MRGFTSALAISLVLLAAACGGSSSETPPPLQPDQTSASYTGPHVPSAADDAAALPAPEPADDDAPVQPRRAAAGTWGSGKVAPSPAPPAPPAPSMSSPTALPPKSAAAPSATPPPSAAPLPPSNF